MSNEPGDMHCWAMAYGTEKGVPHIYFRGLNFDGHEEGGKWVGGGFDKGRLDANKYGMPVYHVPTSRYLFGDAPQPTVKEVVQRIWPQLTKEWPALAAGKVDLSLCDQDVPDEAREFLTNGKREAVTRIAIDLGEHDQLPDVILKPGIELPFPRNPVFKACWKDIAAAPKTDLQDPISEQLTSGKGEAFFVRGNHQLRMEVPHTGPDGVRRFVPVDAAAKRVVIFESLVSPLERLFGRVDRVRRPGLRGSVVRAEVGGRDLAQALLAYSTNKNGGPKPAIS